MSSFSLESGEIESEESLPTNNFAKERGGAKFGQKQFGVNEVMIATVSMSMEQSEELRYVTPDIGNNAIGSNVGSTRMLSMSRRKTRKITTTAATFKSGNSPFSDIGIKVIFGEQPIGMVVGKPELPSGAGEKECRKRRTSARKNNCKVQPSKKRSQNKNDSIERFSANENEIDNDGKDKATNMLNYLRVPRKKLVRKPNSSSKNTKSCKESKSVLKTKTIKKSALKETRKPIKRELNQASSVEEIEKTFKSPLISPGMAVEPPLTENITNNSSICQNGENYGKIRDLCQFYIQHQCLKGNDCDHMHEDFPCKYYYLGLKCNEDKNTCKLSHGGPLATDVLDALGRHIVSDPVELVGKHFIEEVRSNKTPQELVSLLHEFQAQLRGATQTGGVEVPTTKQCTTDDKLVMRQKLYFLTEEQIKGLEAFNVCHIEQALQLTLWQLNSIGINKATQLEAIMGVVLNEKDVEMRELSPPLKSSTTEHLPVYGESETNADEYHDAQPLIIDEKSAIVAVEENCISKNNIKVTCVEPLQRICKTIVENELRSATKRMAQRLQEVKSSNAERVQKKKKLMLIMEQLNILGDHDKILKNNTTKQTRPPTSNDISKGGEGMQQSDATEEAPDNLERNNLSDYIKDQLEIKLETNFAFSDMKESNVNTVEDATIEVGKITDKPLEAEISINKKIAYTTLEKTDERENPKSSSEGDDVVKMILRSQRKNIQSKNTKSVSIDQNGVEGENETPKKEITPCSIKPRRLKLPKREKPTERNKSKKTMSDITSITDIKPINRDEHAVSPHTRSNTLISSNVMERASKPISNLEVTDDWEDCIAEPRITSKQDASTVIISPIEKSTLTEVNVDNHEVFEDLRYRLDEKKSVFSVKDNFRKYSTSVYGDAMEPKIHIRNNYTGSYTKKYNQKYSNKAVMRYNRFQRPNSNNFNVKERNFPNKYDLESNKYAMEENKPNGYQQSFFDKYSEQNSLSKKRSYEDTYDSDEDWDKEERRNNNNNTSSINVSLTEPKDNQTGVPESPTDENNVENPPSNLNKGNFSNQHSNLNRDATNSGMKPGEMIDCDWDSEFYSPTVLPDSNQIASPTCPNVSNFRHYTPPMKSNGDRGFSAVPYSLHEIKMPHFDVNKPESLDKLLRSNLVDPRLLKYKDKASMGSSNVSPMLSYLSPQRMALNDPRRRNNMLHTPITPDGYQLDCYIPMHPQNANMLLYNYLQRSPWYQRLMSTMKMQINHSIAELVRALNAFQRDRLIDPTAIFDVFKIDCVGELLEIMRNIGVFIDSNGVIMETKGLNQCGPRPTTDRSIPINATYSFMPPTTCTSSQSLRNAAGRMLGFMPNASQPPSCPTPLPNQVQATPFVSCYVEPPSLLPLTPRRHSVNANNVMTTPPLTEDDEEAQVPGSDIGYFKNKNYRKFEMGSSRRRDRPAPMGSGSADGRRNRNDSNFSYQRRY